MSKFNRRDLMVGAGGLVTSLLVRRTVAEAGGSSIPPAPVARVAVVKDTYFGETLSDPYRWMENDKDPDWLPFLKGQNAHARAVLDTIPGRAALLARLQQLSGDTAVTRRVERAGGKLFFEQRPVGADNFKLFVQEGGTDRVLIDPTLKSDAKSHLSLDWWTASADGTRVVYGLSKDGSEDSLLHILTVADGKDLPSRSPTPRRRIRSGSMTAAAFLQPADRQGRHPGALPRQPGALPPPRHRPGRRPDPDEARPGCAGAVRAHPDAGHCDLRRLALRAAAAAGRAQRDAHPHRPGGRCRGQQGALGGGRGLR
jgi:hypothetical protein